jgi:hypothetical protein
MVDQKTNREASLNSVVDDAIENRLRELHTCLPGIIEVFNVSTQRAQIRPGIKRIIRKNNGVEELRELPKLINCPLGVFSFGNFVFTFPVQAGDECMLHFTERSLDAWIRFGDVRRPNDIRMHHESDAYFLPVKTSDKSVVNDYDANNLVLRNRDNNLKLILGVDGNLEIVAANINLTGDVNITGNLDTSGTSTAADHISGGKSFNSHGHMQLPDSNGDTQQSTLGPT